MAGLLHDTLEFGEVSGIPEDIREELYQRSVGDSQEMNFRILTNLLIRICRQAGKPVVLMVDEVDQAGNYQVFTTFLGVLRDMYLKRDTRPAFQSVILAGVYDIKNLKDKVVQKCVLCLKEELKKLVCSLLLIKQASVGGNVSHRGNTVKLYVVNSLFLLSSCGQHQSLHWPSNLFHFSLRAEVFLAAC